MSVLSEEIRCWSRMEVQLLGFSGKTITVEYFQPNVNAVDFFGALYGMLCMGIVVRSADVWEKGRGIEVASIPTTTRSPPCANSAYLTKVFRRCSVLIRPSSKASYKLGHLRWKKGDCDKWGKDWACVSAKSASTVSKRAALAR